MRASAADVVRDRDLGRCLICGSEGTDGHHRDPVGQGGAENDPDRDLPERIILLCRTHHSDVHGQPWWAGMYGWYLPSNFLEGAEDLPVWSPIDRCWYLLLTSGIRVAYPNWRAPEAPHPHWITSTPLLNYRPKDHR